MSGPIKGPDFARLSEVAKRLDAAMGAKSEACTAQDGVILLNGSTIKPAPVAWLWPQWLALGKFHVLAGPPGQGKTTIALACIAIVTKNGTWPDGSACSGGNVLIWSGEDDPQDTLLPRLMAMGADVSRVYFVTGTRIDGKAEPFDPARDMANLRTKADQIGNIRLLVVDPVVSAVAGDSNKNAETRRALQPLVDLAAGLQAAVLGISHFTKGSTGRDPVERVTGSLAFGALARVVLCAVRVKAEDEEDRRVLARAKSNIGPDGGGFEYGIEQRQLDGYPDVSASIIVWGKSLAGTARELLAEAESEPDDDTPQDDVAGFLTGLLADGPVLAKTVLAEASGAGYSGDQVRRAARRLNVEHRKAGMSSGWVWALPTAEDSAKVAKMAPNGLPPPSPPSAPSSDEQEAF